MKDNGVILIIMDGWGIAEDPSRSAIHRARVPFYLHCLENRPFTTLQASGEAVGLPAGQMGNSEVGHINIGAGRVVYQELEKIRKNLESGEILKNQVWRNLIHYCVEEQKPLHLMGLVSDGGVHSSLEHLKLILSHLKHTEVPAIYIHCFLDGRDTDPKSGLGYVTDLMNFISDFPKAKIASLIGRYYAMDRDKRWERVAKAYNMLVHCIGKRTQNLLEAIQESYDEGMTDEFFEPVVLTENDKPLDMLSDGDAVLFFNFRTDRGRELTEVLTQKDNDDHMMQTKNLKFVTMTCYDQSFIGVEYLYEKDEIVNSLGETLAAQGKKQIRIAETEKYPHVTFFFNGGKEELFEGEKRILCPSPKVATYDLQPEMSAFDIRDSIIQEIEKEEVDFVCLNFANPDMVGHTGVFEAAVRAIETVDSCVESVVKAATAHGYTCIIIADHGNADCMQNPDGSPHTAHTTVPVPCILVEPVARHRFKQTGKLADVAPTILYLMDLNIPEEMTGDVLLEKL
jgi:2,3-bisphosphoglycerate-independent phosphoglycerate mutase